MIKRSHIIGLIFLALGFCFAFSPSNWTAAACAQMEVQDGAGGGDDGGKEAGDPDMPDTQPPPSGVDSQSGLYGSNGFGAGYWSPAPSGSASIGSGSNATSHWRGWLRSAWLALRVQFGWF